MNRPVQEAKRMPFRWLSNLGLTIVLTLALMLPGPARAQSELLELAEEGCRALSQLPGYEWICYAAQLPTTVQTAFDGLHGDMAAFGEELLNAWLQDALASIGERVASEQLERIFQRVDDAVEQGPIALRQVIREAVDELRLSNAQAPRSPEGSPDWWGEEAALQNPNLAAAQKRTQAMRAQLATTRAEAAMVHGATVALAEEVADATASQDAVAAVVRPALPGGGGLPGVEGGTAAQLEERARTAVSSRAALVVLSEGLADLMRQDAVFSGSIIEHLRVLSQQQVQTTWQLQLAVNTLTQQLEEEIARDQAALQRRVNGAYAQGRQLGRTFGQVTEDAISIVAPEVEGLRWDRVGW